MRIIRVDNGKVTVREDDTIPDEFIPDDEPTGYVGEEDNFPD